MHLVQLQKSPQAVSTVQKSKVSSRALGNLLIGTFYKSKSRFYTPSIKRHRTYIPKVRTRGRVRKYWAKTRTKPSRPDSKSCSLDSSCLQLSSAGGSSILGSPTQFSITFSALRSGLAGCPERDSPATCQASVASSAAFLHCGGRFQTPLLLSPSWF